MKKPTRTFNPKRTLAPPPCSAEDRHRLEALARQVQYGGNPEHKLHRGDFGLTPPAQARSHKTLCDRAEISRKREALELLRQGIRRGLISQRLVNGWPKNVWAVAQNGEPVEAILENEASGTYHGYSMGRDDPLRLEIKARWNAR